MENSLKKEESSKLDSKSWKLIILFGLFQVSWAVIWGAYNNYFPITLQAGGENFNKLGASSALGFGIGAFITGLIMTLDNFFGMAFAPFWGAMSDQSKSRKRIVVCSGIIAAFLVMILPFCFSSITPETNGHAEKLILPLLTSIVVAFFMILFWSISESANGGLVFSSLSSKLYNRVSSITSLFGGIGFIVSMLVTSVLYKIHYSLPYLFGGSILLLTMMLYAFFLKEPKHSTYRAEEASENTLSKNPFKALVFGLRQFDSEQKLGIFKVYMFKVCGIFGIMGFQTYASTWGVNVLGVNEAAVSLMTALYFLGYLLATVPVGFLADKLGRKKTGYFGLVIMFGGGLSLYLLHELPFVLVTLFVLGMGNAVMDVIPMPLCTEYAPNKKSMGILVSVAASLGKISTIMSVPLVGIIIEKTGDYGSIFAAMSIMSFIGFFVLSTVKPYSKKVELG